MIENMSKINEVLQQGGVIAYVTDTVWGVGCLPDNEEAVKKIYEIKHRDGKKPLILMSDEVYNLFDYVRQPIEKEAQKLIKKHFPGALTLVLEKSEKTPDYITSGMQTVGIRIPDNETFAEICRNIDGRVLATTSANLSGKVESSGVNDAGLVIRNVGKALSSYSGNQIKLPEAKIERNA